MNEFYGILIFVSILFGIVLGGLLIGTYGKDLIDPPMEYMLEKWRTYWSNKTK